MNENCALSFFQEHRIDAPERPCCCYACSLASLPAHFVLGERLRAVAWERLSSRHSSESDEGNEL
jgi:hypothetical protein